jgi:hypothetical protein
MAKYAKGSVEAMAKYVRTASAWIVLSGTENSINYCRSMKKCCVVYCLQLKARRSRHHRWNYPLVVLIPA